jgi:hypothetical protein
MLQSTSVEGPTQAPPCPGLIDDAGVVRDACRVCGKCDDIIRGLTRDIAASSAKQPFEPARMPA